MRLFSIFAFVIWTTVAFAQVHADKTGQNTVIEPLTPSGSIILNGPAIVNGTLSVGPGSTNAPAALPHVTNNIYLQASAGYTGAVIVRDGFYGQGDGGRATYYFSAASCSLNGGLGDNGSQVPASYGGCWIDGDTELGVKVFGALGDMQVYAACTMYVSSANLTCTQQFQSSAIGEKIFVRGAGAGGTTLVSTIQNVSGGIATLASPAQTSITGVSWQQAAFGHDDTSALTAAFAWLSQGKTLIIQDNSIYMNAGLPLSLDNKQSIVIRSTGYNRQATDYRAPQIVYMGTSGNLISIHSVLGAKITGIGLTYFDPLYNDNLIYIGQGTYGLSAEIDISENAIAGWSGVLKGTSSNAGTQAGSASSLIAINGGYDITIENNYFANAQTAIQGPFWYNTYANKIVIDNNTFYGGFAKASIQASGQGWDITRNTFEPYNNNIVATNALCGGIAVTSVNATFAANGAISTGSPNVNMSGTNPGWVVPGTAVYDINIGLVVGLVSSWTGTTLTFYNNASYNGSGSSDSLLFGTTALDGGMIMGNVFQDATSTVSYPNSICIDLEQSRDVNGIVISGNQIAGAGTGVRMNTIGHTNAVSVKNNTMSMLYYGITAVTGPNYTNASETYPNKYSVITGGATYGIYFGPTTPGAFASASASISTNLSSTALTGSLPYGFYQINYCLENTSINTGVTGTLSILFLDKGGVPRTINSPSLDFSASNIVCNTIPVTVQSGTINYSFTRSGAGSYRYDVSASYLSP